MPLNILRQDFEMVLRLDSGITDWKEDLQHLYKQLQRDQVVTCDRLDFKQKKKDDRKVLEKMREYAKKVAKVVDINEIKRLMKV